MKRQLFGLSLWLFSFLASTVQAADSTGFALAGKLSSLGYGAELGYRFNDQFALRAGANIGSIDANAVDTGTNFNYNMTFNNIPVMLDWFVAGGAFRITGGLVSNNNILTGTANGVIDIGSTTYTGSASTETRFAKTSSYFGIGWSGVPSTTRGFGISFDLGILFQGSPTTTITSTSQPVSPADIAAQEATINENLKNLKYWPVVSLEIGYTF